MAIRTLFLAVILMSSVASAYAFDIDAAAQQKLDAGEPVTRFTPDPSESAAGLIEAVIDIPAPLERVYAIVTDCPNAPKVFNGVTSCRIVSAEANGKADVREFLINWSRLLPTVRSVFRSQYDPPRGIVFNRTDGDLKQLKGEWRFEARPNGMRLHYAAAIAVGLPVPSALVRVALESDMPKTLKAIRAAAMAAR